MSPRSCCQKQEARSPQFDRMALYFNLLSYVQKATSSEAAGRVDTDFCDSLNSWISLWLLGFILFTNTQPKSTLQRTSGLCLVTKTHAFVSVNMEIHCTCAGYILGLHLTFNFFLTKYTSGVSNSIALLSQNINWALERHSSRWQWKKRGQKLVS